MNSEDKNNSALADEALVTLIVSTNDKKLIEILYSRYSTKIYNKCYSFTHDEEEAKDLTQDIFIKLFSKLDTYRGKAKFSTWLYSFTYNFLVNYKKRDLSKKLGDRWENLNKKDINLPAPEDVEDNDLFALKTARLEKALSLIEPADKALLLMKYQDDISIKEMQLLLEIGESAIKMRLKRARFKLIKVYNERT
ncbi:RNA polymerase sigma factor [Galbibacter sp. BG1]|uniref:RNA polymerase sigma factor n=1 Tax=Galbibacter sp. BG1 TaxID=1170699 RepID=UPI0015B7FE78|nr:RNA polymerase sigma factor [Galbibacter sp. BG1]QLE00719.1 RNA polymerase sigma factor [Galbibacter sp. BG1]